MDVHAAGAGDISDALLTYSHKEVVEHGVPIATNLWQVDVSAFYVKIILGGIEDFACLEGDPSAEESAQDYVENHPVILPPLVVWTGQLILRRFWPILILIALIPVIVILVRRKEC